MSDETSEDIKTLEAEVSKLEDQITALEDKIAEKDEKIADLEAKLKIYVHCMEEVEYQAKQAARDTR